VWTREEVRRQLVILSLEQKDIRKLGTIVIPQKGENYLHMYYMLYRID